LFCSEREVADLSDTVPAPKLIAFRGVFSIGINHNFSAMSAPEQ
jgi:hypothetical protein